MIPESLYHSAVRYGQISALCLFAVVGMVAFASCEGNKTTSNQQWIDSDSIATVDSLEKEAENMPRGIDVLFDDFFFNFAGNSRFQEKRILPKLQKGWKYDSFFMEQGYYTLIFSSAEEMELTKDTTVNKAILKRIDLKKRYSKDYIFRRLNGNWYLTAVEHHRVEDSPNSSFLYFYYRFANDPKFQMMCLHNPLIFIGPDPDDDFASIEGEILPETWPAFCPSLLPKREMYNIVYGDETNTDTNTTYFIIRGIANGMEIRMTFGKENGVWTLQKYEQ
ncbi:MAG: DUF4348 domain-containing protein [Prevotella sp.]|nr:DUF4348 domain-containing protein [Candidatus Equicola faecalis]